MQLKSLTLNFGQHRSRTWYFDLGVSVIRGANESGKSTLITGWMYNWFGAQMLAENIDAYVPWGEKKSALRTGSVFTIAGQEYSCSRGASGAELRRGVEVLATNHAPVTAKIEQLLGIPPGKVSATVYAAQSDIRGALALGPTASAAYIESMADFTQIDQAIQMLAEKLDNGSTKLHENQIKIKEQELQRLRETPDEDTTILQQGIAALRAEVQAHQDKAAELRLAIDTAGVRNKSAENARSALLREKAEIEKVQITRRRLKQTLTNAEGAGAELDRLEQQCLQAQEWNVYQDFLSLPSSDVVWDGDLSSLLLEVETQKNISVAAATEIRGVQVAIAEKERQKLTTPVCPYTKKNCNHLTDPQVIEETNRRLQTEIEALQAQAEAARQRSGAAAEERAALEALFQPQRVVQTWAETYPLRVKVNKEQIPWGLTWSGPVPPIVEYPADDLEALRRLVAAAEIARGQLSVLPDVSESRPSDIDAEIAGLPPFEFTLDLEKELKSVSDAGQILRISLAQQQTDLDKATADTRQRATRAQNLIQEMSHLQTEMAGVQENNEFIKAVKAARLAVSDLLWNKILASASVYFSRMRGTESVVTRTPEGFVVNGEKLLSGSTLDILGLALRITTAKLFSQCSILVLDEANAGADLTRSAAMTGVLAGAGFSQVFLVTHKEVDEAGCDNLIQM